MAKDRSETGRYVETTPLDAVLGVFEKVRGPVVTSADVADELDCSRDTARRKLAELHRNGRVDRRETAGRVVWWLSPDASTDERATSAGARKQESESGGSDRRPTEAAESADTDAREQTDTEAVGALVLEPNQREAVRAMYEFLRRHGTAGKSDFIEEVYPEHPAGYQSAGGWWNKLGKNDENGLAALPNAEKPGEGRPTWSYVGD